MSTGRATLEGVTENVTSPVAPAPAPGPPTPPTVPTPLDATPLDPSPLDPTPLDANPLDANKLDPAARRSLLLGTVAIVMLGPLYTCIGGLPLLFEPAKRPTDFSLLDTSTTMLYELALALLALAGASEASVRARSGLVRPRPADLLVAVGIYVGAMLAFWTAHRLLHLFLPASTLDATFYQSVRTHGAIHHAATAASWLVSNVSISLVTVVFLVPRLEALGLGVVASVALGALLAGISAPQYGLAGFVFGACFVGLSGAAFVTFRRATPVVLASVLNTALAWIRS